MHELSIAISVVEIVEEEAAKVNSSKVSEVELDIGAQSGVIIEALEFALAEAVKPSIMKGSKITINEIPAICRCAACGHKFEPDDIITPCPECGHLYSDAIQGKEMKIKRIVF